ncbi:PLP-dependent aminotransferase family protein [Paenibacillus sp. SYP-B3998]|uniref:PLP-dependent aminotransferase family protein n=1 Tax=Paenibacillus sp. SYP-B3998 TaxID=2678564 RepID=A0A6G4A2D8_9BACL|nr:PLP-dependent aminotransferase family protein [Paenibacillus sp. SYP-B3998]NEW08545.1 PLP-dependent aminotransferase family protein [Paenibacillus sp. SYP-B3998]
MNIEINRNRDHKESIPMQITRQIETMIVEGTLAPGSQLPTERYLSSLLGVHRSTVTKSFEELRAVGLIQSAQGRGTFVSDSLWNISASKFSEWRSYMAAGLFRPTQTLLRKVRELTMDPIYLNLADGEMSPDLLPADLVADMLKKSNLPLPLHYPDSKGEISLRQALSSHLFRTSSISCRPEHILITSGAQQALHLIAQCLLSPGDSIAIEGPSYHYSLPLFGASGIRLLRIPVDQDGLLPDELISLHKMHRIKMVITSPTYQNPTGTVLPLARRQRLIQICEEHRIPIVEDQTFGSITLTGEPDPPLPLLALSGAKESILHIGSMSKTTAPGLRLGWLVGPSSVIDRLADAKQQMDFGTSPLLQHLVETFITSSAWTEQREKVLLGLTVKRNYMLAAMDKHLTGKAEWVKPTGGYHIWCKLLQPIAETELLERGIRQGVLFVPGGVYGADKGYVRFSFARANRQEIEEGIAKFARILEP